LGATPITSPDFNVAVADVTSEGTRPTCVAGPSVAEVRASPGAGCFGVINST